MPVLPCSEVGKSMPHTTHPQESESKFRVLYLGPDLEFTSAIRKALPQPDYRLVSCSEYGSAVLFLKSEIIYDLLLIDLEWRDAEGLKLATLARSLSRRKRMPIVLVSEAELSGALKAQARKAGVNEWVTKTADMSAVSDAVRRLVEDRTASED